MATFLTAKNQIPGRQRASTASIALALLARLRSLATLGAIVRIVLIMRGLEARDHLQSLDPLGKSSILKSVLLGRPCFRSSTCLRLKPVIVDHKKTVRMRMDSPTCSEENQPTDQTNKVRSERTSGQGELPPAPSFFNWVLTIT